MAPENEGKPAGNMSGRTVDVPVDSLVDMQRIVDKLHGQMKDIISVDVSSLLSPEVDKSLGSQDHGIKQTGRRSEGLKSLAVKHEYVKDELETLNVRLKKLMFVQKPSDGDMLGSNLHKRSRPPTQLHESRVPGVPDRLDALDKFGLLALPPADAGDAFGVHNSPFDSTGEMPRLKMIRTEPTKAPYQKPTIYMPQAKLGVPVLDAPNMLARGDPPAPVSVLSPTKTQSPKKRPPRSRRERNRARTKVEEAPPVVMQKLNPGDTNKIPEDGFLWRKYGNKPIKTANFKRGYYKCRHFKEVNCNATKIVQQTDNDPSTFSVCYKGVHTCQQQGLGGQQSAVSANDDDQEQDQEQDLPEEGDDVLDDMEWPTSTRNPADSANSGLDDDPFGPSDGGEETTESSERSTVTTMAAPAPPTAAPLVELMEPIAPEVATIETPAPWAAVTADIDPAFTKSKYEYPETCPPEGQGFDQSGIGSPLDSDNDQLLKLISGGCLWENNASDINYWSLDSFPFPTSPDLTF